MKFPFLLLALCSSIHAETLLVEAEQFSNKGGWGVDTQFIETMGSPYLIAHGLGKPVTDATTEIKLSEEGDYRIWVRTIDWTKRLGRPASAGRFQCLINGKPVGGELGSDKAEWAWQSVASINLKSGSTTIGLHDLTGYDGRVDAVLLSNNPTFNPPVVSTLENRTTWKIEGVPTHIEDAGNYDLVVIGGGYGGLGSAISAARMGAKVALIQNRMVLGGNGSSEIRVWAKGDYPPSEYPLADIIREIEDKAKTSPAPAAEFVDDKKEKVVRAEKNITLFLGHHVYGLEMKDGTIAMAKALEVETGKLKRITGKLFVDCTGHGFIGQWAGADVEMVKDGRMGMSNMWMWDNGDSAVKFDETPWMLSFDDKDFPYPRRGHAEWFWESGFDDHPIKDLETTRDWNLVASFSAWNAIKNKGAFADRDPDAHAKASLTWLAYVGGTRETQQILGDVVLSGTDIEGEKKFDDGTALTTWTIDLHVPQKEYVQALPEHPFISKAIHRAAVDKRIGYPIPYRCFYSRNVPNLFMAGRNISVNRDALGTIRVMKTIGMMGVTVGRAAALCVATGSTPREIYSKHLDDAKALWSMPGDRRFETTDELRKSLEKTGAKP